MVNTGQKDIKVLIVDDEQEIVELLSTVIEGIGGDTITAGNGLEALEKIGNDMPDIVFSDIYMPKMNGIHLTAKVKQIDEKIPVVVFTGMNNYKKILDIMEYQPDYFLEKPIDIKKIIEIMLYYFPQFRR